MLNKNQMLRLHLMMLFCVIILVVLLGRMVYLQLWRSDYYAKQSDGNRLRQSRIVAPRGVILDNKGKQLVNNVPGYMVALQKQNKYKEEILKAKKSQVNIDMAGALQIKALEDLYKLDFEIKSGQIDRFYGFELFLINFPN